MTNLSDRDEMLKMIHAFEAASGITVAEPLLVLPVSKVFSLTSVDGGICLSCEGDDGNKLIFNVTDYHEQDCCENVYADWETLLEFSDRNFVAGDWRTIEFCGVEDAGFLLRFTTSDKSDGYFCPCHNEQNGYYSGDLALKVSLNGRDFCQVDISAHVKDDIN